MEKTLKIPQKDESAFFQLVELEDKSIEELINKIYEFKVGDQINEIDKILQNESVYTKVLFGLYVAFIKLNEPFDIFIKLLYKTYSESQNEKNKHIPLETFSKKFEKLFASKNPLLLTIISKYFRSENENKIITQRIISDVRPLFSPSSNKEIVGTIILHKLNIAYEENDDKKMISFYLDLSDLKALKAEIDIALEKSEAISCQIIENKSFNLIN